MITRINDPSAAEQPAQNTALVVPPQKGKREKKPRVILNVKLGAEDLASVPVAHAERLLQVPLAEALREIKRLTRDIERDDKAISVLAKALVDLACDEKVEPLKRALKVLDAVYKAETNFSVRSEELKVVIGVELVPKLKNDKYYDKKLLANFDVPFTSAMVSLTNQTAVRKELLQAKNEIAVELRKQLAPANMERLKRQAMSTFVQRNIKAMGPEGEEVLKELHADVEASCKALALES